MEGNWKKVAQDTPRFDSLIAKIDLNIHKKQRHNVSPASATVFAANKFERKTGIPYVTNSTN
jgi:hypothetical protein